MQLVDVHAHLDDPKFSPDLDLVLARAKANGVVAIILQGVSHEKNTELLRLAKRDPILKVAMGIYPLNASNVKVHASPDADADHDRQSDHDVDDTLRAIGRHGDDIIAIGEVGMDLQHSDDEERQTENFRKIVRLAKRLRKPLIIHSRKAERRVLDILEEEQYFRAVMHCFSGSHALLKRGLALGLMFSIPTAVVRNKQFQENAALIPVGQLLTETDAPYMGPYRNVRNEPANIREAVLKLAEIKRMDPTELANIIYFNYQKMFL
jgi:TatD DNase family protein